MKKILFILVSCALTISLHGHEINYEKVFPHTFTNTSGKILGKGFFLFEKNRQVCIESITGKTMTLPINELSADDRQYIGEKTKRLKLLNGAENPLQPEKQMNQYPWILAGLLIMLGLLVAYVIPKKSRTYTLPLLAGMLLAIFSGFRNKVVQLSQSTTSTTFLDSVFAAFVPEISTYYNNTYYYVQSNGLPKTHTLMVGISNHGWQQQVPIPQCYYGSNAWPIPLNPVMAANPIPVDSIHFTRGAIAVAANGIPIFNVHTNTGVDSYLDGQLDNYGGHCGRADDYHYHIAPLHLYNYTPTSLPCAMGLDGYAVYGSTEPDGSPMQALDVNHGHYGSNGVYHYHGTASAPYMIARMAGEVTEDNTHQLVPQAAAHGIRPALTPLNGALIIACTPNASYTGFNLTYVRNGQTDSIVYTWTPSQAFTFRFYTAGNGTFTQNNYQSNYVCNYPLGESGFPEHENHLRLFPNPGDGNLYIEGNTKNEAISIAVFNLAGSMLKQSFAEGNLLNLSGLNPGIYMCRLSSESSLSVQKIIIR
jgi:hypothetical protein